MSVSQKQAVITFIEKKGKDRSFLENWRPISLLNVENYDQSTCRKNKGGTSKYHSSQSNCIRSTLSTGKRDFKKIIYDESAYKTRMFNSLFLDSFSFSTWS